MIGDFDMTNKHPFIGVLFGILAALLLGLGAWPVLAGSRGQTDRTIAINPPRFEQLAQPFFSLQNERTPAAFGGVSPLVIPAAAFASDGFQPDSLFFPFGGGYFQGDSANYGCVVAPAYLPQGATVTDMFASVYDNDPARGISVALRRLDNFNGSTNTLATASTTGAGTFAGVQVVNDASIDNPLVVQPDYTYYVTTCLGSSSIRLYSVRFYYAFADLAVTKSASSNPANAGAPLAYTINISNTGTISATGVVVSDTLPLKVTYQNATASQGSCMESGGLVTCNLGDMLGSSTAAVTITTSVNLFATGTLTNTAAAEGNFVDGNPEDNQGSIAVPIRPPSFLPIIIKSFP